MNVIIQDNKISNIKIVNWIHAKHGLPKYWPSPNMN